MPKILINGELHEKPVQANGQFQRIPSSFRNWISAGPDAKFPAARGRYHLYLSKACPWCHGVELVMTLKGLSDAFSITWMDPISSEEGWVIDQSDFKETDGVPWDQFLYQVYQRAVPNYTGSISVPLLLDKDTVQIVSTESSDIMRMLNSTFAVHGAIGRDLYPAKLASEIDRVAELIQAPIRNGVYRAGFATSQEAYSEAVLTLFESLEEIEELLTHKPYLAGAEITEVDLKLFPTLVRFDPVYVSHFKTDRKRIADYPALSRYMQSIARVPEVASTIDMGHIREHYFRSHRQINPTGIISIGPAMQPRRTAVKEMVL